MHNRTARILFAGLLAATTALAACSGDDDADDATPSPTVTPTATATEEPTGVATTTPPPPAASETSGATPSPATATGAATPAPTAAASMPSSDDWACDLVGTWDLRDDEFASNINEMVEESTPGSFEYVSGDHLLTLNADGTMETVRDEWSLRVSDTEMGSLRITMDAADSGMWSATADTITTTVDDSSADVSMALEQDGELVELPGVGDQTVEVPGTTGSGTYTCDGDVLTINLTEGDAAGFATTFDRVG